MPDILRVLQQLKLIYGHPLNRRNRLAALQRYFYWQFTSMLSNGDVVVPFVAGSRLTLNRTCTPAQSNFYSGLADLQMMGFLLHFLKETDVFYDVGAFVGTYTVLASAVCKAHSVAFEPTPATLNQLRKNLKLNSIEASVTVMECAVGAKECEVGFFVNSGAQNHVQRVGESPHGKGYEHKVRQVCLNQVWRDHGLPSLMKIDAEGVDIDVLQGANEVLEQEELEAVIIESWSADNIKALLNNYGFELCVYDPLSRLLLRSEARQTDELYVRDFRAVSERVSSSDFYLVNGERL